jgi:protein-L-isoaspartate(D-aspartate) O-methyltransferase
VFERSGWIAMAVIAMAAGLGVFGDGWLSKADASAGAALRVEYPRFGRAQAPLEMTVDWQPQQGAALTITRSYLEQFAIEEIRPTPAAVSVGPDSIHYTFRAVDPEARIRVSFRLKPQRAGTLLGRIGSEDELAVEIRQLVFP